MERFRVLDTLLAPVAMAYLSGKEADMLHMITGLLFFFFFKSYGGWGKIKHHTSTYFHTRRVSI